MKLEFKKITCGYGKKKVIKDITFEISTSECVSIMGTNGVGKTTLFKSIFAISDIFSGEIQLEGRNIRSLTPKELSNYIAFVPQSHESPFPFSVMDIVVMGRKSKLKKFETPGKKDYEIALKSLESMNIGYLKDRFFNNLSGGEKQLVLIARALTQDPKFLILDEPVSNLDYGNQLRLLDHIKILKKLGIGILMTSHFPNHVFYCSDKVAIIENGRLNKFGKVDDILNEDTINNLYNVNIKITESERVKICFPVVVN